VNIVTGPIATPVRRQNPVLPAAGGEVVAAIKADRAIADTITLLPADAATRIRRVAKTRVAAPSISDEMSAIPGVLDLT
jgi:hypothetical protein